MLLVNKMEKCPICNTDKKIRNPTGNCDHLYYPDYLKIKNALQTLEELRKELEVLRVFGVTVKDGVPHLEAGVCTQGDVNAAILPYKKKIQELENKLRGTK